MLREEELRKGLLARDTGGRGPSPSQPVFTVILRVVFHGSSRISLHS